MPNPPWPVTRLTLREDLAQKFRARSLQILADPSDVLELMLTAFAEDDATQASLAAQTLATLEAGAGTSLTDMDLPHGSDVAVVRMGPTYVEGPDEVFPEGYQRHSRGATIADTPQQAWSAGRGYWRFGLPGPKHLVITRLGRVLGVYRTDSWAQIDTGRIWADKGWLIDPRTRKLRSLAERSRTKTPDITEEDLIVLDAFDGHTLTYPLDRRGSAIFRLDDLSRARRSRAARATRE